MYWVLQWIRKEKEMLCPVCEKDIFCYNNSIGANKCQNEFCRFSDKVLPASDVLMSFLEYCKHNAKTEAHKEYIEKVIQVTRAWVRSENGE